MAQSYADLLSAATAALKNSYDNQYNSYVAEQDKTKANEESTLNQNKQKELDALTQRQAYETGTANQSADKSLQESYVSRMMAQKQLPQLLSAQGVTGGGVESRYADIIRAYENARNSTETQRASTLGELGSRYTGLFGDIESAYGTKYSDLSTKYSNLYLNKRSELDQLLNNAAATSASQELQRQMQADILAAQAAAAARSSGAAAAARSSGDGEAPPPAVTSTKTVNNAGNTISIKDTDGKVYYATQMGGLSPVVQTAYRSSNPSGVTSMYGSR